MHPNVCRPVHLALIAFGLLGTISRTDAGETTVGRYSTLRILPTQAQEDLLSVPVAGTLPPSVTRVGEAVERLLAPSGYRLAPAGVGREAQADLVALPLPAAHRTLAPLPLRAALVVLAGPGYRLVEDPVRRLIAFERC
ncbi:MAG: hypothetical protein RKL32_05735, partial [Gammaproteobacteria bacterium]